MESNTTIVHFAFGDSMVPSEYENNEEFWSPILSLLKHNHRLEKVAICNITDAGGHPVAQNWPPSLSNDLEKILRDHNRSLFKVDFGTVGREHIRAIETLFLLNLYKLRPFVGQNCSCTKNQFFQAIVQAKERNFERRDDEDGDLTVEEEVLGPEKEVVSCLFSVFQGNPLLVHFLEDHDFGRKSR